MKKNILTIIGIILTIAIIIVIFLLSKFQNKDSYTENDVNEFEHNAKLDENYNYDSNKEYPKMLESIKELPLPKYVIFYHNGKQYKFEYGTEEYNIIVELNNNRDDNLTAARMLYYSDISELKSNIDLLEYDYENYDSVYFNLTGSYNYDEFYSINNTFWVSVGYDSDVFLQLHYFQLKDSQILLDYLNSIID